MRDTVSSPEPEHVHQFRTSVRRVKSLAMSLGVAEDKGVARFEAALDRLFDRAGKVRDVDVQIAALNSLTLPSVADDKAELLDVLQRRREKRIRKLTGALEDALDDGLPKRQRKAKATLVEAAESAQSRHSAGLEPRMELMPFLQKMRDDQFTEETLHRFRLDVKRIRYTAEAAGATGVKIADALKPLQDAIGEWHDWCNLRALAQKKLVHAAGHPILSVLRTKVSGHFAQALLVIRQTHAALSEFEPPSSPKRLEPASVHPIRAEAARAS